MRKTLILMALALSGWQVHALPDAQFQPAFEKFMAASGGDKAAVAPAAEAFAALRPLEPTNPVLLAYSGAATAMLAGTTMLPWKKMSYAEDGLAQLDKALALLGPAHEAPVQNHTPGVLEVKFVAANTFLAVPGFMNRADRGGRLLNEVLRSPLLAQAPLTFRGNVWLKGAEVARQAGRVDEARRWLNQLIEAHAPQAEAAQAQLKALAS